MRDRRRFVRPLTITSLAAVLIFGPVASAFACGGLVTPNGTVNLLRTTTLAAYHRGIEHYVTSFSFAGSDATEVGSIVPLPGVPSDVIKGGDWTLQRLIIETESRRSALTGGFALAEAAADARVLFETEIDALDITVLEGGSVAVGDWAREHGFFLPPDAPEVLEFYASRSPIFMAVRFNVARAEDQAVQQGEGTPVHVVIPTPNPWVPLRILSLGRQPSEVVEADVYLLTDRRPATLPVAERSNGDLAQPGIVQELSERASASLMTDLRSDRGMKWMPKQGMWLTHLRINTPASELSHDLAIDASGFDQPDPVAAGFILPRVDPGVQPVLWAVLGAAVMMVAMGAVARRRAVGARAS